MASSREERRLQRLRGAQTHQVGDLDFGIQLPTITAARSDLPPQPSNRRTPSGRGRGRPPGSRPTPKQPTPPLAPITSSSFNNANTSAKRRKIEHLDEARPENPPSSSNRSTRSRGKRDVYDIEEDPLAEEFEPKMQPTPTALLQETDELEADEESLQETPLLQAVRRRTALLQAAQNSAERPRDTPRSGRQHHQTLGGVQTPVVETPLAVTAATPASTRRRVNKANKLQPSLSPEIPKRRSPRITQVSVENDDLDELSPAQPARLRDAVDSEQFSDIEGEELEEAEAIDELEAAKHLGRKRKRKQRSFEVVSANRGPELPDEESDELAERPKKSRKRGKSKVVASPAIQRQGRKKTSDAPAKKSSRDSIPVMVHRLTKPIVYGEDDTDADILNAAMPHVKRSGANAVDVLSQVCEELIESAINTLEEGGNIVEDSKTRREYRTKLRAVEGFQEELRLSLFELTAMLDADYILQKRVRDAQREKIQLRQDLLRIRAKREQIALQMDEVRIKHEAQSKESQAQIMLNTAIHDIEMAVELGRDKDPNGQELGDLDIVTLLDSVAGDVSSKSRDGGILRKVKEFNAFLERAALALEGRS